MVTSSIAPTENIRSWQEHEFWEDAERVRRRRQRRWIGGTLLLFLILISVPVWGDRAPKWGGLRLARELGTRLNQVKRQAAVDGKARRARLDRGLRLVLETASTCASKDWADAQEVLLGKGGDEQRWEILGTEEAARRGIPGVVDRFCYDPLTGYPAGGTASGWAIAPVADRENGRVDRISVVFVQGAGGDIQFE